MNPYQPPKSEPPAPETAPWDCNDVYGVAMLVIGCALTPVVAYSAWETRSQALVGVAFLLLLITLRGAWEVQKVRGN